MYIGLLVVCFVCFYFILLKTCLLAIPSSSVAAAQADHFEKISNNKLNKIDKNMKIKRRIE